MANLVEVKDVSYYYPKSKKPVLDNISFHVEEGEYVGIVGATGAGKTTLCMALNGIIPQFYGGRFFGSIHVLGMDTFDCSIQTLSRHVGMVFEDPEAQLLSTSIENEIAFALENLSIPRDEMKKRIKRVLEMVRLTGYEHKHPHELSGGQKQRLAIACSLALEPKLMILDEPTSQLDPVGTNEVFETVKTINKELGISVIIISHAAEEMALYADRVLLLEHGKLVDSGTAKHIYTNTDTLQAVHVRAPQVTDCLRHVIQDNSILPITTKEGVMAVPSVLEKHALKPLNAPQNEEKTDVVMQVENLTHVYPDGFKAIQGVNLNINKGEYLLIVGQNGAGKSTLVKHFLNLLKPTQGDVLINGKSTSAYAVSELANQIGYVAQNPDNQIFSVSVLKEVQFALQNLGYSKEEIETRSEESLAAMGLLDLKHEHPLSLPKGDRARVVIAAILALHPDIIIFDEPTTGQDYQGSKFILDISKQLNDMGKTVIVITHHLYLMPDYAKRVVIMKGGTVTYDAPIRDAFYNRKALEESFLSPIQAVCLGEEIGRIKGSDEYRILNAREFEQCVEA